MNAKNSYPYKLIVYSSLGILAFLALVAFKPFAIIKAGDRGVVMRFGKVQSAILDEGIHPIIPVVNSVQSLTVRVQKNDVIAAASSKDLQDVKIAIALNWHINPEKVNSVFQRLGDEEQIVNRIIDPAVSEIVKAASAQKNAEEIITKRNEVKQEIDIELQKRLNDYGILVDDVSLVDIAFSPEFTKAIEAKQIAEQQAKQADYEALKAEKTAQAEINRAKGQAEAQRLQKLTLTPALLQKEAITKWDGRFPMVMGGDGALPFINIDPQKISQ
jgi:regulator of protease activity HflC (stomatin/prohibitin superfamily)